MNLLDKIIDLINEKVMDGPLNERAFQNSAINGLSYLTAPKQDSPQRPYVIEDEDIIDISIDDTYDFSIYHRCTDISFTDAPASAWGDGDGMISASFGMLSVVYGDRFKLGYSQEDIILKLTTALNMTLTRSDLNTAGLSKVRVIVNKVNNNPTSVFATEYGAAANCPLQMNSIYFSIQYTIDITANQKCLECQDC